ncbi:hypothetical protein FPSE5266_06951 [Fusarium pseudograminearum]|nr:hypothetical protein FPSE5266_06951 [Fusarium pseudograminearum]
MCLGSFKFWKKRQKDPEESPTHSRPQLQTNPSPVVLTASVVPAASIASVATVAPVESTPNVVAELQERLWNRAYDEFKDKESDLVTAYEELISSKAPYMRDNQQNITLSPQEKWDQMRKTAEEGLQTTERSTEIQGKIHEVFELATPIKGIIDRIMPSVPQAQVPWLAVSLTFEIFSKPFKEPGINRAGLLDVISKIQEYMSLSDYLVDDNGLQSDLHRKLEKDTVELYKALLSYQIKSIYCFHKNELKRFFRNVFKIDDWSNQLDAIKAAESLVWEDVKKFQNQVMVDHLRKQSSDAQSSLRALTEMSMGMRHLIRDQQEREIEKDNKECRQHLKQTDPSLDKERILDTKGNLLRESYGWVIDHPQFQDWKTNVHHRRLWIRGDAGKGKTMLLCGIIEELEKDPFHRLCYFFCQATDQKLRDGKCVLRGLLFHLIKQYPWLISHVRKDYDDSGEKLFNDHNAWQALRNIFLSVLDDESLDEVTIIVDALDECMIHRDELLKFICDVSSRSRAKIIVSSRPLSTIQKALQGDGSNSTMLALELNDDLISDAVKRFIDNRVASLAKTEPFQHDPEICDEIAKHLTDNANNTFLWVALVCQELSSGTVQLISHVKAILKNSPPGLDNLYDQMLETIRRESRDFEICIEILAANSVVTRPVSIAELLCILDANVASELNIMDLERIIMSCGSFLHLQKGVVYFIHQSAVDFLLKDELSRLPRIADRHRSVFLNALYTLQASPSLKRDIYNVDEPGLARKDVETPDPDPLLPICYSCIHWVDHLREYLLSDGRKERLGSVPVQDVSLVYAFLNIKFLFWIEALSLLQNVPQAIKSIQNLQMLLGGKSSSVEQPIKDFVHDANRFLLYHKYCIQEYPLQIYAGCLVFSPKDSIVKNCFQSHAPKWVTVAPGLDRTWDACLQTLVGHTNPVLSAMYSPDDLWIASASENGVIKFWDAESGTCIHTGGQLIPGFDRYGVENSYVFSTDDGSFVRGSRDGNVEIWDPSTGNIISKHRAHKFTATNMAISSDSSTFAYFIHENTVLIWYRKNEISSREFSCSETVRSLALSAGGEWLAMTTMQQCMIWNTLNGDHALLGTGDRALKTVWSMGGQWLVTLSEYHFIDVWERQASQWSSKIKFFVKVSHTWIFVDMALSSDAKLLAVASLSNISVWNTETGALVWATHMMKDHIISISFSNDSLRLLTGLDGNEIKVWDLSKDVEIKQTPSNEGPLSLRWFDANRFSVYSSGIREYRLYGKDTSTRIHLDYTAIASIASISPDGQQVASASTGFPITIWDALTGNIVRQLKHKPEEATFGSQTYQDTQEHEVQCSTDNAANTDPRQTRKNSEHGSVYTDDSMDSSGSSSSSGSEQWEYPEALSFDNTVQLASSVSGIIRIWNTSDGTRLRTLDAGDCYKNDLMVFSKTGRQLVVQSYTHGFSFTAINLWDTVNGTCLSIGPQDRPFMNIEAFSFSPDSLRLVATAGSPEGRVIYLWEVSSGTLLRKFDFENIKPFHAHFDKEKEQLLHTEYGSFDTTTNTEDARVMLKMGSFFRGYGLSYSPGHWNRYKWIVRNGKPVLFIPDDYRTEIQWKYND